MDTGRRSRRPRSRGSCRRSRSRRRRAREGSEMAQSFDVVIVGAGDDEKSSLVQEPESAFASTYERMGGGTTWHWLGTCLRHFPNDLRLRSAYGHGVDWPISYDDLNEAYGRAEWEIGVAAERTD